MHAVIALQVFDYRNDVILAETCREDVNKFCKKVEIGRIPLIVGSRRFMG